MHVENLNFNVLFCKGISCFYCSTKFAANAVQLLVTQLIVSDTKASKSACFYQWFCQLIGKLMCCYWSFNKTLAGLVIGVVCASLSVSGTTSLAFQDTWDAILSSLFLRFRIFQFTV